MASVRRRRSPSRTPTPCDRTRRSTDIAAVAPVSTTSGVARERLRQLDDDDHRHDAVLGLRPVARGRSSGRFINATKDQADARAVTVLGSDTASELFGGSDPVGETVSYNGVKLEVDRCARAPELVGADVEQRPRSRSAQHLPAATGRGHEPEHRQLDLREGHARPHRSRAPTRRRTRSCSTTTTSPTPSDADFSIATAESVLSTANSVDDTLTVMLGGIAFIALLVGGIGVMNIMLVSVTERIREIGLRKAIGARPASIRRQFVVEAGILGLVGGILGVVIGVGGRRGDPCGQRHPGRDLDPCGARRDRRRHGHRHDLRRVPRVAVLARLAPIDALRSE